MDEPGQESTSVYERVGAARAYRSATEAYTYVVRQPSWVLRLALMGAGIMLLAVLAIIIVPALLVGVVVFVIGAGIARARRALGSLFGGRAATSDDGRQNVKVIVRSDQQ